MVTSTSANNDVCEDMYDDDLSNTGAAENCNELVAYKRRIAELEEEVEALRASEAENWELAKDAVKTREELDEIDAQHQKNSKEAARVFTKYLKKIQQQEARIKQMARQAKEKDERIRELELALQEQQIPQAPLPAHGSQADIQQLQVDMEALELEGTDDTQETGPSTRKRRRMARTR